MTRQALLAAALALVAEHGFEGTSVRAIARRLGVSHGTVQHHFPTKAALWRAIVDEVLVPEVRARLEATSAAGTLPSDVLAARITAAGSRPGLPGAVLLDASDAGRERLDYLARAVEADAGSGGEALEALVASGELRGVDLTALRALLGVGLPLLASAHQALRALVGVDPHDPQQRDALAEGLTDIVLHGILARPDGRVPALQARCEG